jgi:hypothetical protein
MASNNNTRNYKEFSKFLLLQESALVWVCTLGLLILAYICIRKGFLGSLPWLAAMAGCPWAAYGISQAFYYNKSKAENTKNGIKFESVMAEVNAKYGNAAAGSPIDWRIPVNSIQSTQSMPNNQAIDLDYGI